MVYILHNPLANNGKAPDSDTVMKSLSFAEEYRTFLLGETDLCDFRDMLTENDKVILCGGDGTLNRFINDTRDMIFPCRIYLYHAGTGNDFMNDVADKVENNAVELSPYLDNLPEVTVNGNTYLFINGIGFGIDGVACEIADDMKAKGAETINYAAITVKQLLFKYKCPNATVTVDGEERRYSRVWLASAMKGRYYGGGMIIAPEQNREDGLLSCVVLHGGMRLKALLVFTKIFKGEHVKHKEMVDIRKGKEISVVFDRPTALQIDGETIRGVTSYTARAAVHAKVKEGSEN